MQRWLCNMVFGVFMALCAVLVQAQSAPPTGKVVLRISGLIAKHNTPTTFDFDARMLDALAVHEIRTATPWYPGAVTFSGPLLADVLQAAGVNGTKPEIKALNDYQVTVPVGDAKAYQPILARKVNGKVLTVREKGPLFLIYPFDSVTELKNDIYYARSIWQIASIQVK